MSHRLSRWLLPAGLVAAASSIGATERAKPDPLDPAASTPAVVHRSALAGYQRTRDDRLLPWKQANEEVARIGGWRAYARDAAQAADAAKPSAPAASPAASAPASAPGGHGRH